MWVMWRKSDEVTLRADRLSCGGCGVGRLNGYVVFVNDAAPGDLLRARLMPHFALALARCTRHVIGIEAVPHYHVECVVRLDRTVPA